MNEPYKKLPPEQLKKIKKILIIQQKPFGDILLNTGYFPALRKHFPDAQIDYLIQKPYITILEDNPYLDNLVLMDKAKGIERFISFIKTICIIRKAKYDLIIDQLRGTSSVRLVAFSGARWRLGFKLKPKKRMGLTFNRWNWIYNLSVSKGEVRYYSRWKFDALLPLGITEVEHNTFYHVKPESFVYIKKWISEKGLKNKEFIVFSPGTPVKRKQWDLGCYAELGDMIQNQLGIPVVLLWGPDEAEDVIYIENKMKTIPIVAPPTTFNQAGALLNMSKFLVTNDGGINHLAVSQEVPSISIFGPKSNPLKWCAWHKPIHIYLKDFNNKNPNDNRFNITPDQVFKKVVELSCIIQNDGKQI